jgi:hypothetical protein
VLQDTAELPRSCRASSGSSMSSSESPLLESDSSLHCTYRRQHWAWYGDKVVFWRVCFYFFIGLFVDYALLH